MLGFLNFYKPTGCTSHDCVAQVRRALRLKKVGHGGTLDPAASGVLPMAVGQATRLLPYLREGKAYQATIRFGLKTTTDDLQGDVIETAGGEGLSLATIEAVLPDFLGRIRQVPPRYSAIQVQGKRLYALARCGESVEVPERNVTIHTLTILHWRTTPYPELDLAIECGAGTYIRSLARDLGDRLGTGATLAALSRTQSSGFNLENSVTLDQLHHEVEQGTVPLLSPANALGHLAAMPLAPGDLQRWQRGQRIALTPPLTLHSLKLGAAILILDQGCPQIPQRPLGGECLGLAIVASLTEDYPLQPKVVFNLDPTP